jgi:molecular chaperone GrpE
MAKKNTEEKKDQQEVNVKDIQQEADAVNGNMQAENEAQNKSNSEEVNEDMDTSGTMDENTNTRESENSEELLEKKEQLLEEELNELRDKYVRLSAEFDNYRKRTLKEKMELTKSAGESILLNIIPVVDDFERGMETMDKASDIDAVKEGIHLIHNKFKDFLKQSGVKEIEARDKEFNTDEHDAVTKIPAPGEEQKGKVVDVIEKGYKLNDRVIRFSKVVVGE